MRKEIIALLLIIACLAGYIINIFSLINSALASSSEVTTFLVLQIVGIFAWPLGVILGWISLFA